jgi:hypothetical protein
MQYGRSIARSSAAAAALALLSCGGESNPMGPGGNVVERVEFIPTSIDLGTGRATNVEVRNTGTVAVGPISLVASTIKNSAGVDQPTAELTPSPSSIATLNPGGSVTVQLAVNAINLSDGAYGTSLSARRGSEVIATVQLAFLVSSAGGPPAPVNSIAITGGPTGVQQGEVGSFAAEARDASGAPLAGVQINWAVEPLNAGLITAEGKFVGYGTGRPLIIASAGSAADTVQVTITARSRPSGSFVVTGQGPVLERFTSDLWANGNTVLTGTWSARSAGGMTRFGDALYVWDITNPDSPTRVDSVLVNARTVNDVKFSQDGQLAVLTHEGSPDGLNGITLLDMSAPASPSVITRFTQLLEQATTGNSVHNVWIDQGYVYISDSQTNDFRVVDVRSPSNPQLVANRNFGSGPAPALHDVYVRDGLAFLSNWTDGLIIVDVGNGVAGGSPTNPVEVSRIAFGPFSVHNAWYWPAAGYVFLGDEFSAQTLGTGIVKIVDVSDPTAPLEVASIHQIGDSPHNFWLDETRGILYAAWYGNGVNAFDVNGELLGRLDLQDRAIARSQYNGSGGCFGAGAGTCAWAPQLHNGRVYVSDLQSGLKVLQPNF